MNTPRFPERLWYKEQPKQEEPEYTFKDAELIWNATMKVIEEQKQAEIAEKAKKGGKSSAPAPTPTATLTTIPSNIPDMIRYIEQLHVEMAGLRQQLQISQQQAFALSLQLREKEKERLEKTAILAAVERGMNVKMDNMLEEFRKLLKDKGVEISEEEFELFARRLDEAQGTVEWGV